VLLISSSSEAVPHADRGSGEGILDPDYAAENEHDDGPTASCNEEKVKSAFAPGHTKWKPKSRAAKARRSLLPRLQLEVEPRADSAVSQLHNAWSTAVNSRLGRVDNERFMEHFRYIIVASQLLNEYLDQGSMPPAIISNGTTDGSSDPPTLAAVATDPYGAAITALIAFALVYLIHWARGGRGVLVSRGRVTLALTLLVGVAFLGYAYLRRQWLKLLRQNAVDTANSLTANWQTFEVSSSSALSFIQEVELVSKGYKLTTPLPPASRIEEQGGARRCARLRKVLHRAYSALIPACIEACQTLRGLIDEDDSEKYLEVYDISPQDVREASGENALAVLEDDGESLKSLRVLSYRSGVLRRLTLCSLMALEADGGKPDFYRWRVTVDVMMALSKLVGNSAEKIRRMLNEMDTLVVPQTPAKAGNPGARDRMRCQVRKISMLSSGIRGLQAKMQILREETNRSIEQSEDLSDVGPSIIAQYDAIGADLKELMQAWETGKASLQSNITKQENRLSMASSGSGLRSPLSSISGLTAVEELGTPEDALKVLNGDTHSNRSSMVTTPSDEEQVFEAIAVPKQRSTLSREERIIKMQEERDRQAALRAKRESNTSMLRELESVINLRPKKAGTDTTRITSI
jgi:hypothetical protein